VVVYHDSCHVPKGSHCSRLHPTDCLRAYGSRRFNPFHARQIPIWSRPPPIRPPLEARNRGPNIPPLGSIVCIVALIVAFAREDHHLARVALPLWFSGRELGDRLLVPLREWVIHWLLALLRGTLTTHNGPVLNIHPRRCCVFLGITKESRQRAILTWGRQPYGRVAIAK